ncbi:tetratricopeptide protein [Salpingoeca rosetta]|uniref:Tetratricopeptide protein n=1 Tax=Salpingoeca rosetta (strain ATCC 50818 / BSB-021) TaxID=946362 RepID=F2USX9_SALR5|nr:tetratricopeptide protein [Salpingoeca rosetta]EGD81238.1 tetratricopeptide protein [Salpingoeca rosetta]|eukprot:XP_004987772.1 tetratricopeptide protein [Salpingoeca rosetta]
MADEHRLTDGVSVEAIKTFFADLKKEFPDTYTEMTTEDACKQLVVPRTRQDNCAYVEQLRKQSPEHVNKATVFVSHAWRYKIADVLNVLLEFAEEQASKEDSQPVFFWFDLFMNNQNANVTANLPQEWWSTTFKKSIANIGHVLLVLMPWRDPVPLTRAWCLWEIFCGISNEGTEVTIQLPKSEEQALEHTIYNDYKAVTDTLVRVQAERADAFNPHDKHMIFTAIESWAGGFGAVNQAVKDQLRAWCLQKAVGAVETMRARGEDKTDAFAGLCGAVGSVLSEFGEHDKAIAYYETALAVYLRTEKEKGENVAVSNNNLGNAYCSKGEYDRAIAFYEKDLAITVETLGEKHPSTASTYNNLGTAYYSKGDFDKAIHYYKKALAITVETLGEKHPSTADSCVGLGIAYEKKGELDRAIAFYEQALAIMVEALGEKHPNTADTYNNIGSVYYSKGDYDRAIECFDKALAVRVETLGEKHPSTAQTYNNLGGAYHDKGDYDKAIALYEKALAITVEALGEKHPSTATSYNNLGGAYARKGEYDKAIACYEKALAIYAETLGEKHPSTADTYNNLGAAYVDKGQYGKAIHHYEQALAIKVETLGEKHPSTAMTYFNIGLLHDTRGDKEQACAYVQQALDVFATTLGPDHPNTRKAERSLRRICGGGAVNAQHASTQHVSGSRLQQQNVLAHRHLLLRFISSAVVYQSSAPQRNLLMRFLGALAQVHAEARRPANTGSDGEDKKTGTGHGCPRGYSAPARALYKDACKCPGEPLIGWLRKRGRRRAAFRPCWCKFDDDGHLAYGKCASGTAKRRIPLSSVQSAELAHGGEELHVAVPGRTFVFRLHAHSDTSLADWCTAINNRINTTT